MLVLIAVYGALAGDIGASLAYLFTPDFSKITPAVIQSAVGQGFFSVGVGAAMLITYGAYLDKSINLGQAAITIALADTAIAFSPVSAFLPLSSVNRLTRRQARA